MALPLQCKPSSPKTQTRHVNLRWRHDCVTFVLCSEKSSVFPAILFMSESNPDTCPTPVSVCSPAGLTSPAFWSPPRDWIYFSHSSNWFTSNLSEDCFLSWRAATSPWRCKYCFVKCPLLYRMALVSNLLLCTRKGSLPSVSSSTRV